MVSVWLGLISRWCTTRINFGTFIIFDRSTTYQMITPENSTETHKHLGMR